MSDLTEQMNNLSVNNGSSGYVPPHRRNSRRGGSENNSSNGFSRGGSGFSRGGRGSYGGNSYGGSSYGGNSYGSQSSYGGSGFRRGGAASRGSRYTRPGVGRWVDGKHEPSAKVESLEKELFGTVDDATFQSSGINFDNYDDIPVEATGTGVPEPITTFTSPPLNDLLVENVHLARFNKPTPVQKYSVPICIGGRDLMACAQTGSGKTGGFLFPVLSEMYTNGPQDVPEANSPFSSMKVYPTALVLAPTRELVIQIFDEAKKFAYRSWVKPCVVYGGPPIQNQIRELEKGGDLLVATPGRLKDLLERGRVSLQNIKYLVLDEADRMLDMGFEPQIRHIVQECDMPDVQDRQTLMFSATFPKDIQYLARDFLKEYIFLSVGRVGATSENITQKVLLVEEEEKKSVLLDILATGDQGLSIIFTETKRMADTLADFLYDQNFPATAIHGDRSQYEREKALAQFKSGQAPILVATAVAARGLDIPNVSQVINYDLPSDIDDYVHRIGRTGRAGNTGNAIAFFNRNNKNICKGLIDLLTEANQEVPDFLIKISRESNYGSKPSRGGARGGSRNGPTRDFRRATGGGASNWGSSGSGGSGWGSSGGSSYNAAPSYGNARGGSSYGGASSSNGNQGGSNNWW